MSLSSKRKKPGASDSPTQGKNQAHALEKIFQKGELNTQRLTTQQDVRIS